jgi:hypothetical protein
MSSVSLTIIALSFALLIGAFVLIPPTRTKQADVEPRDLRQACIGMVNERLTGQFIPGCGLRSL